MQKRTSRALAAAAGLAACASMCVAAFGDEAQYEVGGPLAGVKLPLFPTQHGEPAGYPGCIPELAQKAVAERAEAIKGGKEKEPYPSGFVPFTTQGLQPEVELYPGSVEHFRDGFFKYLPIRSEFDSQSLLKNFVAPDLPGADRPQVEEYAEPIYWVGRYDAIRSTGLKAKPVPVVRCKVGSPVFKLDLGTLDRGMYAVRVIAAVETENLRPLRASLFLRLRVNDGSAGEQTEYRKRVFYDDQFYGITAFFFHAPERRHYAAELAVDAGSEVDLLVHNITLDNALTGCEWQPLKTARTLTDPKEAAPYNCTESFFGKRTADTPSERQTRDAAIWNSFPPLNAQSDDGATQFPDGITMGAAGHTVADIEKTDGKWEPVSMSRNGRENDAGIFPKDVSQLNQLLVNKKLNLVYTMEDLAAHKPLPAPFPYKDDGAGVTDPEKKQVYCPIAEAVNDRIMSFDKYLKSGDRMLRNGGRRDYARDSAIALCRFAYDFPSLQLENTIPWMISDPGLYGRDPLRRIERSQGPIYGNFIDFIEPIYAYDSLFDYIKGNDELAQAVGRFVPWVKTPADVQTLLDVYLVQTMAKRVLRYEYYGDGHQPTRIAELATAVGDRAVTGPWMEWLFSRVFYYPLPTEGLQDLMICGNDREGPSYLGSASYCLGEGAAESANALMQYLAAGGDPKYDMSDLKRYPKALAHCYWALNTIIGGQDRCRIGDVTGPDKAPGAAINAIKEACLRGWKWSSDPKFAWVLKNVFNCKFGSHEENRRMDAAASSVKRAPWLDNRSRAVDDWFGVLEAGLQYDDYRFRRAVYVRAGMGQGHSHDDSLDLQVFEHGLPMTVDGGQRGEGYSSPRDSATRVHNTVEVNESNNGNRAWVRTLSDAEGARYMSVDGLPPEGAHLFRRQVALIDVEEGTGAQPLTPEQEKPGAVLPKGGVTGDSYVFDVFRVSGGNTHAYCFHGPVSQAVDTNLPDRKPIAQGSPEDKKYLGLFSKAQETQFVSPAPKDLVVTWRMMRLKSGNKNGYGSEQFMMGPNFDPQSPPKSTRLTLFGLDDATAYLADSVCNQWSYHIACLMVKKTAHQPLESAFTALIEPYVGEPFIASSKSLGIPGNENDAQRAAAVEVKTRNGHTDFCFADGRPEKTRKVGPLEAAGEFAYYSTDGAGLRQATLTGGTLLSSPDFTLKPAQRERTGKVVKVDYAEKNIWIDQPWPASDREQVFEIGDIGGNGYTTSYTAKSVRPDGAGGSEITVTRGADFYRSEVQAVNEKADGTVRCSLAAEGGANNMTASDDSLTHFWRATGSATTFTLAPSTSSGQAGAPVTAESFGKENVLRIWEYGVGDSVRQSTHVSLRRVGEATFELEADIACDVGLPAESLQISTDGKTFSPAKGEKQGNLFVLSLTEKDFGTAGKVWIKK